MTDLKSTPWTTAEIKTLIANRHKGAEECAHILNRSIISVKSCANKMRISLRKPGESRGLVLGQPRNTCLTNPETRDKVMAEIRELALNGKVDLTEIERRMRDDGQLPTCPECYRFPVRHPSWGLCDVCRKKRLKAQHREQLEVHLAQKELNASKQELKRYREEHGIRAPKARD